MIDEKTTTILDPIDDRLVEVHRDSRTSMTPAYPTTGIGDILVYIFSAMHHDSSFISFIIDAAFQAIQF